MEIPKNQYGNYEQSPAILLEKITRLERENTELRLTIESNGLQAVEISETEFICIEQLKRLKEISMARELDKSEVIILDLLHKNLLVCRNIPISKKTKEKKKSVQELLKIVNS